MDISFPGLSKLKSKEFLYENELMASDPATLEHVKELTAARKAAIDESSNDHSSVTQAIAREVPGGLISRFEQDIQKVERYLPLLENLVRHVLSMLEEKNSSKMFSCISNLKIRWSSTLTSSSIFHCRNPKFYQVNDIYFELGMTLLLYGALLRERAVELLSSDMVQSAALFRKAAGVYTYVGQEIAVHLYRTQERPPESTTNVCSVISFICLAEAQAVTARKGEENGNRDGLLAKLHYGVKSFLDEAHANVCYSYANKECKDLSPRLQDFIVSSRMLHELKSYKHLAKSLRDEDQKIGPAIGVLRWALSNAKKSVPKEESWKLVHKQAINEMSELLRKYERENEFLTNEKIPCVDELPSPQSVKIVSVIPYQPQKQEILLNFKV